MRPAGSAPDAIDHVYGEAPPLRRTVCEYDTPTTPAGSGEDVVMANGLMGNVNTWLAVAKLASVTVASNAAPPAVVGVPLITQAEEMERPGGNAPRLTDQEYGETPPVAERLCEYGRPTAPEGNVDEVSLSEVTARVNVWLAVADVESVTVMVKLEVLVPTVMPPPIQVVAVGAEPAAPAPR